MVKKGGIPWNKGKPAWNRGMKWSEETKKRISEAMKRNRPMRGKHYHEPIRKRMREGHRRAMELRKRQMPLLASLQLHHLDHADFDFSSAVVADLDE